MLRQASLAMLTLAAAAAFAAPEFNPVRTRPAAEPAITRLIVKLRPAADGRAQVQAAAGGEAALATRLEALGARAGVLIAHSHSITGEVHVVRLFEAAEGAALEATLSRLRADAAVAYADPDYRRYAHASLPPDDPLYGGTPGVAGQWYMQAPQLTSATVPASTTTAAVNAVGAWAASTGSAGVVIADLDTGIRFDHPDLQRAGAGGKLLPGYDFVGCDQNGTVGGGNCPAGSSFLTSNDGDGWDADPSDPGDWLTSTELATAFFKGCTPQNKPEDSSWHGTRTAGILAALTNNATGIAGMAWNSYLLPVRVLGKCGGYDSDIITGMLWASGIAVSGAPANPYPARIINMSLGGATACTASYTDAFSQVNARGVVVAVSAGNEGGPIDTPANCPGAIAVVGVRHVGSKVGYSSLGPEAALAAPAGNCINTGAGQPCLFTIDTTTNLGTTTPGGNGYTDQINFNVGTSFSAPIVGGIAALMLAVNGNLTPAQVRARLQAATRAFPVLALDGNGAAMPTCAVPTGFSDTSQNIECNCTTGTCGAGLADAAQSVAEAARPIAALSAPAATSPGASVALNASGSGAACGQTVASYAWSITSGTGALTATSGPTTSLNAPASGTVTVQLVVTDSAGKQDIATIVITPSTTSTTAPASAGSSACLAAVMPPAPAITFSVAPTSITAGQNATLTWSVADATGCTASGAWSGNEPVSGTMPETPASTGAQSYTLTCSGTGGSMSDTVVLTVNAAPSKGGGGGAFDAVSLALGALAGLGARLRRRAAGSATR